MSAHGPLLPYVELLLFTEVTMNRKSSLRQLALFVAELPNWESLPQDRQLAVQEILSLLLEQALPQNKCTPEHSAQICTQEKSYV